MLHLLLSPLSLGLAGAVVLIVAARVPRVRPVLRRTGQVAGAVMSGAALVLSAPWGANQLVGSLERSPDLPPVCGRAQAGWPVVVLSGGFDRYPSDSTDVEVLSRDSFKRLSAGMALARGGPGEGSLLVLSGGAPESGVAAEATVLAGWARQGGWPEARLRLETESRNTWENAQRLATLTPPLPRTVRLVSTAMHLPRAAHAMRWHGFTTCVWPADDSWVASGGWGYYVPQSSALVKSERALHEWVGLLVQRWRHGDQPSPRP